MGKSVPKGIKSKANIIMLEMPQSFNEKFTENKVTINELKLPFSKWTTNVMAGFITRTIKNTRIALEKKEDAKNKRDNVMKAPVDMAAVEKPVRTRRTTKAKEATPVEVPAETKTETPVSQ